MDRVVELIEIVQHEVADYAGPTCKGATYHSQDDRHQLYSVIIVPDLPQPFPGRIVVMARVIGDREVIDEDATDRPLYEKLMRSGIPYEQIVLAYAGETLPAEERP